MKNPAQRTSELQRPLAHVRRRAPRQPGLTTSHPGHAHVVPRQHRFDGLRVALRQPEPLRMFIHDEHVPVAIGAAEQAHRVMREAVIQCAEPFARAGVVEVVNDVDVAAERREELAGGDVPIAFEPRALLPAGEVLQDLHVFGVRESIVRDARGNESRLGFAAALIRHDELLPIPGMAHAAGIGGKWILSLFQAVLIEVGGESGI